MSATIGTAQGMRRAALAIARRGLHPSLILNIGAPFATFQVLTGQGVPAAQALLATMVFPLITIATRAVRSRRLDPIGALTLASIAVGVLGTLAFHDSRLLLVKDSLLTGLFGLACLASLGARRPLMFVIGRQFAARGDAAKLERYDARWQSAGFRAQTRRLTLIWGLATAAEAGIRVALSFVIAPATLLAVSPLLSAAVFGPLAIWTLRHRPAADRQMFTQAAA